jgi:hypothetical protein
VVGLAGDEVGPSPLSVDLVARLPLGGAPPHTVRFDDAAPEPELGEIEIRVEESPATRLIASHRGDRGDEKQARFLFRGQKFSALEDRSITFRFEGGTHATTAVRPAPSSKTRAWWWWIALPALVVAVAGVAVAGAARARRRR